MFEIIIIIMLVSSMIGNVIMGILIRGFILGEDEGNKSTIGAPITGTEIELIRRKLVNVGMRSITRSDMFNMMATIRGIHMGTYTDKDPYMPADPYEDIGR